MQQNKLKLHLLYDKFRCKGRIVSWARIIWTRVVLPKHSVFTMLAMQQRLATVDQLQRRHIMLVNRCVLCKKQCETHQHLFFKCRFSASVWQGILAWMNVTDRTMNLKKELHWIVARRHSRHWKAKWFVSCLSAVVYSLWEERNLRIFQGLEHDSAYIIRKVQYVVNIRLLFVIHSSLDDGIIESINV
ncbi:uncharacterized protein LOC141588652 [Silene latifolia]|uniref:uncharacterized protein LOC141588652 n=1 Tax=Silene latifolia TaxID=37657 RepID=UPI003D775E44